MVGSRAIDARFRTAIRWAKKMGSSTTYSAWTPCIKLVWRSYAYKAQFDRKRGRNSLEFFSGLGVEWVVWIP
jgi:hypothetical protein